MDLIAYAIPVFVLAMAFELYWGVRTGRNTYRINDAVSSLFLGVLSQTRKFVTLGAGAYIYHWISEYASAPQMDAASPWTWAIAFIMYDFCYYWLHRLGHERTILWAAHVAHHQSEDYNLSTALRQTSTGFLLGWVFYIPMFVLGIPAEIVLTVGSANLIYQFWVHTEHVEKMGWYEWFFVTPSNHRVHHAQNDCYLDKNYGGVFILWDRLFGTFQEEREEEPPVFGIRGPLRSFNPVRALTHIYWEMLTDFVRAKRWSDKWRVLVARTGWRPEDLEEADPRAKNDLRTFERYDPSAPRIVEQYALFQLIAVVTALVYLQQGVAETYQSGLGIAVCLLGATVSTARWMDQRAVIATFFLDFIRVLSTTLLLTVFWNTLTFGLFNLVIGAYLAANVIFLTRLGRGLNEQVANRSHKIVASDNSASAEVAGINPMPMHLKRS
ncbi:MAG: sterol desaturase family protein [Pseudomonadota bacterium]